MDTTPSPTGEQVWEPMAFSLEDFELGKAVGRGQFSEVFRARYKPTDQYVALKRVQLFEMADEKARNDCLKEVDLLKKLNHRNVIRYLGSFMHHHDHDLYIVLELADAGDLLRMIRQFKKEDRLIPEKSIWKYFIQICSAIHHMHSHRIMHRDIKPANVFLTRKGVVKLGDLGLGRFFSSKTADAQSLVGTPYYMSPERIKEKGYDFKSDIWSLGCMLYEMAALHSPFWGEHMNLHKLSKKIEKCDYPKLNPKYYSNALSSLVAACIASEPNDRPDIEYVYAITQKMYNEFIAAAGAQQGQQQVEQMQT